jgi:uncharacterized protein (DUF58 family)
MLIKAKWNNFKTRLSEGSEVTGHIPTLSYMDKKPWSYLVLYWINFYVQRHFPFHSRILLLCALFFLSYTTADPQGYLMGKGIFLFLCLILVNIIGGLIFRPKVSLRRHMPSVCHVGFPVVMQYDISNESYFPCWDARLDKLNFQNMEFPKGYAGVDCLRPKERISLSCAVVFSVRGHYHIPQTYLSSSFPFGLWFWGKLGQSSTDMLVLPRMCELESVDLDFAGEHGYGESDAMSDFNDSGGQEFMKLREYKEGDSPKYIHWMATARLGKPIVKDFNTNSSRRISLYIDLVYKPRITERYQKSYDAFEASISLAASIVEWAYKNKVSYDYFFINNEVHELRGTPREDAHSYILEKLAKLKNVMQLTGSSIPDSYSLEDATSKSACFAIYNSLDTDQKKMLSHYADSCRHLTVNPLLQRKQNIKYLEHEDVLTGKLTTI